MNLLKTLKKKIKSKLGVPDYNPQPRRLDSVQGLSKGLVLFSYLDAPVFWPKDDTRLDGHSNNWESREIVTLLRRLGFAVDVISWTDQFFYPVQRYDVVFDIHTNLQRWMPFLDKETKKILHLTGSYFKFQRDAELARVAAFEARCGGFYSPKRIPRDLDLAERSHRFSDVCSLIGNSVTLHTYPEIYQKKITTVPVSASRLDYVKVTANEFVPAAREFIWFYGGGAVHKGLDVVLEVFKKNHQFTLHVVAKLESERDFLQAYADALFSSKNIIYHGYLHPSSQKFKNIANRVVANLGPSCSEGISPAAVTCMQYGFYPIISRNNGITLPDNAGLYLEDSSIGEIEQAIATIYAMPAAILSAQIKTTQAYALAEFSRENFSEKMHNFLVKALDV